MIAPPSLRDPRFAGTTEQPGGTVLYGPWTLRVFPRVGHSPSPSGRASPPAPIGRNIAASGRNGTQPVFAFQTDAVLFCDDGGVPSCRGVMRELRGLRPFPMAATRSNPRTTWERGRRRDGLFCPGCRPLPAVYRRVPLYGRVREDIHEQTPKPETLSCQAATGVASEASELIMTALSRS